LRLAAAPRQDGGVTDHAGIIFQVHPVRKDALPEDAEYPDDGCEFHPRCQTCPFPDCIRHMPSGRRAMIRRLRLILVRQLWPHTPTREIALLMGVSVRQVQRDVDTIRAQALAGRTGS
jgi:hypothetical protein